MDTFRSAGLEPRTGSGLGCVCAAGFATDTKPGSTGRLGSGWTTARCAKWTDTPARRYATGSRPECGPGSCPISRPSQSGPESRPEPGAQSISQCCATPTRGWPGRRLRTAGPACLSARAEPIQWIPGSQRIPGPSERAASSASLRAGHLVFRNVAEHSHQ
jgi:hypothetical protein